VNGEMISRRKSAVAIAANWLVQSSIYYRKQAAATGFTKTDDHGADEVLGRVHSDWRRTLR